MARREAEKVKRTGESGAVDPAETLRRLEARVRTLELERDGLKAELDTARLQIIRLEQQRTEIVNHIDWAIDSLQSLAES